MSELSVKEFNFIHAYFRNRDHFGSHRISLIRSSIRGTYFSNDVESIIGSLVGKNIFSLSPDGNSIKFTDYGIELWHSMTKDQEEWDKQYFIKVSNIERDQIFIRSGETFKANRIMREIFKTAKKEICILDAYIGSKLFDLLEDSNQKAKTRIVTSDKLTKPDLIVYRDYKKQYPHVEMKIIPYSNIKFHDRFILLDNSSGYHIGHSIKNLGEKDTQVNLIKNPMEQIALFEERWSEAKIIEEVTK
jgi:hypothetical protein